MSNDLKTIKKKYGEEMMHFCRQSFPTLLETPNLLPKILLDHFAENRSLYQDISNEGLTNYFKEYIYHIYYIEHKKESTEIWEISKTPSELLSEAGYNLYVCRSEKDIQEFKKYYAKGEELCTFNGRRLKRCHVFFAVKKDVENIKREDFSNPQREDQYGTSVISIQFDRGPINQVSIKNRYNHVVANSDATFSNDLDQIIPGLTKSFEKKYRLSIPHSPKKDQFIDENFCLPGYFNAAEKNYKIIAKSNRYIFSTNNIVIDSDNLRVTQYDKNKFIVFENYILDLKNKKFILLEEIKKDNFLKSLEDISKISITKEKDLRKIEILHKSNISTIIKIDKDSKFVELESQSLKKIDNYFLKDTPKFKNVDITKAKNMENYSFQQANNLTELYLSKPKEIGDETFTNISNSNEDILETNINTKSNKLRLEALKNLALRQSKEKENNDEKTNHRRN